MAEKKVTKKPAGTVARWNENRKKLIISLINHSQEVTRDVMEVGSAFAKDCLDTQRVIEELAKEMGLKQDSYWSKWK